MEADDKKWRALIDAAVDGMIVIDSRGAIEAFNPSAERMFGYRAADVVGRNVSMLMPSPDRERHDDYIDNYLKTGTRKVIGVGRDVVALRSDGTRFPAHLSVGEMRVGEAPYFVGILHDLTARTQLEARILEQASLARVGEMAAVLAHEVRNPLAAVRGAIQVLGRRFPADSADAGIVREVLSRLDGLNELVQDLLLFARTPTPRLAPNTLSAIIKSTVDLLKTDPMFQAVNVDVAGDPPPVAVDSDLLKIAFQNLIVNAGQAVDGRGTIRINLSAADGRQTVTISDNGPGMTPEVRAQLFKPFFTTKARGTGLGLATVRRLIEAHGGVVQVECPPSGGTVVRVDLPAGA